MLNLNGDALWYRDRAYSLIDAPLEDYFAMHGQRPELSGMSPLSRGYSATWAIEDGWLYLTSLSACLADGSPLGLSELFPYGGAKVFAAWKSGSLRAYRSDASLLPSYSGQRSPDLVINLNCGRVLTSSMVHRARLRVAPVAPQASDRQLVGA